MFTKFDWTMFGLCIFFCLVSLWQGELVQAITGLVLTFCAATFIRKEHRTSDPEQIPSQANPQTEIERVDACVINQTEH